jgi:anion-transporting  ArsA/GET3 family ATPase
MPPAKTKRAHGLLGHVKGKQVIVCVGAGGVGKTTTSAALALGLAMHGQKVAVVTIDPAKRLASSLGLSRLSGTPSRIEPAGEDIQIEGELWAMMLDTKGTFDGIIERLASDDSAREEILANPIYRELSTAVAGSQELSAVAKLYELHEEHDFDVIVLDTPPSRNALDFLETPGRLLGFLEGRALQVFLAPSGLTGRLFGRGTALVFSIFARVTGVDMLSDLSTFFRSLGGIIESFGERTRGVAKLLRSSQTAFVIVTSPEHEPTREALYLGERLAQTDMPSPWLVVNRVHTHGLDGASRDEVEALLSERLDAALAGRVAGNLADFEELVARDRRSIAHLSSRLDAGGPTLVGQLDEEVQDLLGLARISEQLLS